MRRLLVWAALTAVLLTASPINASANFIPKWRRTATSLVGTPYVYGGSTPAGFDCSGFVRYVVGTTTGTWLTHSAAGMYYQVQHVPASEIRPGDLLFFDYYGGGIHHVELALGGGLMVGTSNVVEDADIDGIDWDALVGVGRVPSLTADLIQHQAWLAKKRAEHREFVRMVHHTVSLAQSVGRI